jgi:DNA-binding CsgD family transcriptional regulator
VDAPFYLFGAGLLRMTKNFPSDDDVGEIASIERHLLTRIYKIWDQLAEFEPSRSEEAVVWFLKELKGITRSDDAAWLGVVRLQHGEKARRDHQLGWRTRAVVHLEWTDLKRSLVAEAMKAQEQDGGVPSSVEMAKLAGRFRTLFLRELHDMETFSQTHHYQACFLPFNITDRLWCVFPINADCEVAVILDRHGDHPRFGERDRALVSVIMRGLKWFHRQMVLAYGVTLGNDRLTARERSLLGQLLSDSTEKEIADNLGLTLATVRSYTKSLYAKFGVRGRSGLMALWLGKS